MKPLSQRKPNYEHKEANNSERGKEERFISFSHYLKKKQDEEMKILEKLDYNYNADKATGQKQTDMFLLMKQKGRKETRKVLANQQQKAEIKKPTPKSRQESEIYNEVDSQAVVINNKLIYLKEENSSILTNDHLLHLLKQNNLSAKDYLKGKKDEVLAKITQNQNEKENQIIRDYIIRNLSDHNNGEVQIMDRFYQIKDQLFQ